MNNNFTCVIVDDEQDAIDLLSARLMLLYKNVKVAGSFTSWQEALDMLSDHKPDIIFMDVSMPDKNGIDLLRLLPAKESEIIFITAHEEFAIDAFRLAASGYILKPIDDVELFTAVNIALERNQNKKNARHHALTTHPPKIGIPNSRGIDYVTTADIQYFETVNGYTKVVTNDAEMLSSFSIGKFKSLLDANCFYQVHRSYIINLNCVRKYQSTGGIIMMNNKEIPVSRNLREEFINLFGMVTNK